MKKSIGIILVAAMLLSSFAVFAHADNGERITESGIYVAEIADNVKISGAEKKTDNGFEPITAQNVTYADSVLKEGGDSEFYDNAERFALDIAGTDPSKQYLLTVQTEEGAPTEENLVYIDQKAGISKELYGIVKAGTTFKAIIDASGIVPNSEVSIGAIELYVVYDSGLLQANRVSVMNGNGQGNVNYDNNVVLGTWANSSGYYSVDEYTGEETYYSECKLVEIDFVVLQDTSAENIYSCFNLGEKSEISDVKENTLNFNDWKSAELTDGINLYLSLVNTSEDATDILDFTVYPSMLTNGKYYIYISNSDGVREKVCEFYWVDPYTLGDVNEDGDITAKDALRILRIVAKLVDSTEVQRLAADVNNDGDITAKDALRVLRYVAKLIENL